MSRKYKFGEEHGAYFVSFATVYWIDVFTRVNYFDSIIESPAGASVPLVPFLKTLKLYNYFIYLPYE
jgi:hypothetical protein